MIAREEALVDKLKTGHYTQDDLGGGNKRRLRNIIKNYKDFDMTDMMIENLWKSSTLRWDVVRNIPLPKNVMNDVVDNVNVDKRVFKEFLLNQELTKSHLTKLHSKLYVTTDFTTANYALAAWVTITKEMYKVNDVLELVDHLENITDKGKNETINGMIKICKTLVNIPVNDYIILLNKVLDDSSIYTVDFLDGITYATLPDKVLYSIKNHQYVTQGLYDQFIKKLMKFGGCSKKFRVKYLLKI